MQTYYCKTDQVAINNFMTVYLCEFTGFGSKHGCDLLYEDALAADPTGELQEFAKIGVEFEKRIMSKRLTLQKSI